MSNKHTSTILALSSKICRFSHYYFCQHRLLDFVHQCVFQTFLILSFTKFKVYIYIYISLSLSLSLDRACAHFAKYLELIACFISYEKSQFQSYNCSVEIGLVILLFMGVPHSLHEVQPWCFQILYRFMSYKLFLMQIKV